MFKINLKNDSSFLCSSEDFILIGAQKQSIDLDHSCKTGRCQSCKAKVVQGTSVALHEEIGLTDEDKLKGYILTCVRTPTSDITLDIEDLSSYGLEKVKTIPAKINSVRKLSDDVVELHLRVPPNLKLKYLSGQYLNILKDGYKRSYSIAASSKSSNLVFFIKKYADGKFSNYLFNEAKESDLLRVEGPIGTFFYRKTIKKNIIFLATGTGIAPIKAILEQFNESNHIISEKKVYLFFGGRTEVDLFWKPDFNNIEVCFIPVLSRSTNDWTGAKGYIQNNLITQEIDLADSVLYACGSENMIKDAMKLSFENGLAQDSFYSDAFIIS